MSKTVSGRLASTAGQLVLALVNATLILVVLALVLAWALAGRLEHIAQNAIAAAANQVAELAPLTDAVGTLNDQLTSVRQELADLRQLDGSNLNDAARTTLARLNDLEARLSEMRAKLEPAADAISQDPGVLIDRAAQASVMAAGRWLTSLGNCKTEDDEASSAIPG